VSAVLSPSPATAINVERSVTGRRWVWREADQRMGLAIAQRNELPELVGRLLAARGVGIEEAAQFLEPTLRAMLPDPSRMLDMDAACERLADAVQRRERVAVFADYDVDGACSGALIVSTLRRLGCEVTHYVPDRLAEGYGPNATAISWLAGAGNSLIVCVDCGISAHDALEAARGRSDIVILDHHKSETRPPVVVAAVNPNRPDCPSGLKQLCAAGVAFLAAVGTQRVLRRRGVFAAGSEPDLRELLDLVALATICDVVPLTGPNRALVQQGLKVLARRGRPGLSALMDLAAVRDAPSSHTLGFILGPRINAGGRIGVPDLGLRLLLEEDGVEARLMAEKLDAVNRKRQEVEAGVLAAAMEMAERQRDAGHAVLFLSSEGWHPGVVGIVAGRVKERFNRPACVAGVEGGVAKGSGRSVAGFDLGSAVIAARARGMLAAGGGHAMAAGFTVEAARLRELHAFLDERLDGARHLPDAAELVVEGALTVRGATAELAAEIARLAPFGAGNEEPVFVLPRARIVKADRVGKEGNTIRAFLEGEDGGRLKAICFRAGEGPLAQALLARHLASPKLCGHLRYETWNDAASACFSVLDIAT
jgi:single-stranded-DNA-specific exonuclease